MAAPSSRTQLIRVENDVRISAFIAQPQTAASETSSPTIVFLHFWGGSARTWSLVNPVVSQHYQTVAFDFRGWGESTGPEKADAYSIAPLASDVENALGVLRLNAVVLVGLSMGAKVAQLVASKVPAVRGLVLVSPAPPTPLVLPPEMREQQLHAYENAHSAAFVARNVLTQSFRNRDLPDFVVEDMLRGNRWAREAWPAYAMGEDVTDAAQRISVPVLVVAAEKDTVEPLERVQSEVCGTIPGARILVVPGSGHLSPLDAPETVAQHILGFITAL